MEKEESKKDLLELIEQKKFEEIFIKYNY